MEYFKRMIIFFQPSLLLSHQDEKFHIPNIKIWHLEESKRPFNSKARCKSSPLCTFPCSLITSTVVQGGALPAELSQDSFENRLHLLFFCSSPEELVYFYTFIFAGFEQRHVGEVRMQNVFNAKRGRSNEISHPKVAARMWLCCLCLSSNQNCVVIGLPRRSSPNQVLCRVTKQIPDLSLSAWERAKISPV